MRKNLITSTFLLLSLFTTAFVQAQQITMSGIIKSKQFNENLPFTNITLHTAGGNQFVVGTVSQDDGRFVLADVAPGNYVLRVSFVGFKEYRERLNVGRLSPYLDLGVLFLEEDSQLMQELEVRAQQEQIDPTLDKKSYAIDENISQLGGTALQAMQNLPGVTISQEGKLSLRGSDKVAVLLDGKQTAITGMGTEQGLENIPASAIERIEIINNPSAKYDATGMAGIINIVFKKEQQKGWNGSVGMIGGLGAIGLKQENYEGIRDQFRFTPKVNPSLSLNYRKEKLNFFVQADLLYQHRMMKNEFITREFDDGTVINQQFLENRRQPIYNLKTGLDWEINKHNSLSFAVLYNVRAYTDLGDIPYLDEDLTQQRLWQYYEKEVNQTLFLSGTHVYSFKQPGHKLTSMLNYSFRRKDEIFYFSNFLPNETGTDTTMLIADEHIVELNNDYVKPLRSGRIELGSKQRSRIFPNLITFLPGDNSILDTGLAGTAEYREWLSALYGNYIFEKPSWELEAGLRLEYAKIDYIVDPNHSVYESAGFDYLEVFPNVRASWIPSNKSSLSVFYNRRVDRPEEKDLRVFPTYADPEILQIGNPTLLPQFTQSIEIGYKQYWKRGFIYSAAYHRISENVITTILTEIPGTTRLTSIRQNAGRGLNSGLEFVVGGDLTESLKVNLNANAYRNAFGAFEIVNAYPNDISFSMAQRQTYTGNVKANFNYAFAWGIKLQLTGTYLAADIVPQGKIAARYYIDGGLTKSVQGGKGEWFVNASDIFNTLVIRYELQGENFTLTSDDFFETQVFRLGYQYRF